MAKSVVDIIFSNNKVGPNQATKNIFDPNGLKNISNGFDDFSKTIDKKSASFKSVTNTINNSDCTQELLDALAHAATFLGSTAEFVENSVTKIVDIKDELPGMTLDILSPVCVSLNLFLKEMIILLDLLMKAPLILLKKIEKMLAKVELILKNLLESIEGCLLQVIVDTKVAINQIIREGIIDFPELEDAMNKCPCIFVLVRYIFSGTRCGDAENPAELVSCIRNNLELSPENILQAINKFINDNVISVIKDVFNSIEDAITVIKELMLQPLRVLIKLYCNLLNFRVPTSYLNIPKVSDPFLCFYSYGETTMKIFGVKFTLRTQSIIDIVKSMKIWVSCLDVVCGAISDEVKLELQRVNKDLRLDYQYWMKDTVADIYFACMHVTDDLNNSISAADVRRVFINSFVKKLDNASGSLAIIGKQDIVPIKKPPISEFEEKMQQVNPPEPYETIKAQNGTIKFKDGVEDDVIKVMANLGDEVNTGDYYRKLQELNNWSSKFIKSPSYMKTNQGIVRKQEDSLNTNVEPTNDNFMSGKPVARLVDDESYEEDTKPVLPTYEVDQSFTELPSCMKPDRKNGESDLDLMIRWFNDCKLV